MTFILRSLSKMNPVKLYIIITKQLKVKQKHLYYHFWVVKYISCKKRRDFSSSLYIGFLSYCPGSHFDNLHDIKCSDQKCKVWHVVSEQSSKMTESVEYQSEGFHHEAMLIYEVLIRSPPRTITIIILAIIGAIFLTSPSKDPPMPRALLLQLWDGWGQTFIVLQLLKGILF